MNCASTKSRRWAISALALAAAACASPPQHGQHVSTAGTPDPEIASRPGPVDGMQPEQLLGLSGNQLIALLGPADFSRNDGPAEIWQFRNSQCILDVFLYRDAAGGYRVEHVQTRDRALVRPADRTCVTDLLRVRSTRPTAS